MNRLQAVQRQRAEQDRILINAGHRITLPRSLTESTHEYVATALGKEHTEKCSRLVSYHRFFLQTDKGQKIL